MIGRRKTFRRSRQAQVPKGRRWKYQVRHILVFISWSNLIIIGVIIIIIIINVLLLLLKQNDFIVLDRLRRMLYYKHPGVSVAVTSERRAKRKILC